MLVDNFVSIDNNSQDWLVWVRIGISDKISEAGHFICVLAIFKGDGLLTQFKSDFQ